MFALTLCFYELGRAGDPRFFAFLQSPVGVVVAELFGWDSIPLKRESKTEAEMSVAELAVKRSLEERIAAGLPKDRLTLKDGRKYEGRIVSQSETKILFEERYGQSGEVQFTIPVKQVANIENEAFEMPSISYRDVLFQMEFPELTIYRRPPYTIATELKYFEVEKTVRELDRLYASFSATFKPVIGITNQMDSVQLLYFKNERDFFNHRDQNAEHLAYSSAYYSPTEDRFVMYHHSSSMMVKEAKKRIVQAADQYEKNYHSAQNQIRQWEDVEKGRIDSIARNETTRTLRHEGAHQLFYALGIHSHVRAENIWLIEGLAVYCEEKPLGRRPQWSVFAIREALQNDGLVPFSDLINHRSIKGWGALAERMALDLAYAQSWLVVDFLMQEQYRDGFFQYMIMLREKGVDPKLIKRPRIEVLAESLGLTVADLEQRLTLYADRI